MTVKFVCMELLCVSLSMSSCGVHHGVIFYGVMALVLWIGWLMSLYDMFELEREVN